MDKDKGLLREKGKVAQVVDKFLRWWTSPKAEKAVCSSQTGYAAWRLLTACGGAWQGKRVRLHLVDFIFEIRTVGIPAGF